MLAGWFIKSLFPYIIEDIAKDGVVTEEKVISHAMYLDLMYTQSNMLYDKIPNSSRSYNIASQNPRKESHVVDGMIISTSQQLKIKPSG